jgi:hypothetical protein
MTTALVVTFLSGASTGFVTGRASAPEPEKLTWIDQHVEDVRRAGVTDEDDLAKARAIYERFQERVKAMKVEVERMFDARLTAFATDAEWQIQEIVDRHVAPPVGEKEK